jgi:hypothetical protein
LARYVADHCGRRPRIHRWETADGRHSVHVAVVDRWPTDLLVTALTVDLAANPLGLEPAEYELLMVTELHRSSEAEQLVADAGLQYVKGNIPWALGATFDDALATVAPRAAARHLTAFEPESPELRLQTTLATGLPVRWLELRPTEVGRT